jgi:hypothetical protein
MKKSDGVGFLSLYESIWDLAKDDEIEKQNGRLYNELTDMFVPSKHIEGAEPTPTEIKVLNIIKIHSNKNKKKLHL